MGTESTTAAAETEAEAIANRSAWLKRLADEMEKLVPLLPLNPLPDDSPEWVERVEAEFAKSILPAAKLKKGKDITPTRMGALIGHQCGNAVWMMEFFAQADQEAEATPSTASADVVEQGKEVLTSLTEKWYPAMRRYAKRALCSCVDQSYDDMNAFVQGFSQGFARKPSTFNVGGIGTTSFEIYLLMLWAWRIIERLESVAQFHQVLVKTFGPLRAGELKRTEKICQRVGLHFRKPGRPRKAG